ncbi:MAG TPA: lipoate-protein ligase B, partial [Anaeromyxobacteraceae bacterium]|nr:lipoate-protein ligase B [Anaeromyxobacteraceae bacterium]
SLRLVEETAFAARLPQGFAPRLSAEHAEWGWFPPGEAAGATRFAGLQRAIRLAAALGRR